MEGVHGLPAVASLAFLLVASAACHEETKVDVARSLRTAEMPTMTTHNVSTTIAADSATYFKNRNLWRLDGRVEVTKVPKELFLSQQVFWDQSKGIVYSDSFIHIENSTHMMEGYGFRARQDFTEYSINKPLGIFPAERDNLRGGGSQAPRSGGPAGEAMAPRPSAMASGAVGRMPASGSSEDAVRLEANH